MEGPPEPGQVQPASRPEARQTRLPASRELPTRSRRTVSERLTQLATHEVDLTRPTVLKRNCVHIVPLMESLKLPPGVDARANPNSSSGRLDIFVRVITDNGATFDYVPEGYEGPLYAEVVPRSFPVISTAGTRLAQIRSRERAAAATAPRLVPVTIDLDPDGKPDGIIGYRARRNSGLVDLDKIGSLPRSDYLEPITAIAGRRELVLDPDEFYILASAEAVVVGAEEAAEMVGYDTSVGELRSHYAGCLDCGFGLDEAGAAGSRIVLEVRSHDVPCHVPTGRHYSGSEARAGGATGLGGHPVPTEEESDSIGGCAVSGAHPARTGPGTSAREPRAVAVVLGLPVPVSKPLDKGIGKLTQRDIKVAGERY